MSNICHGNGELATGGCCWVNGRICPLRWKRENGHIYDSESNDLGTIEEFLAAVYPDTADRDIIRPRLEMSTYICSVASNVLAKNHALLNDRAAFEAAWNKDVNYLTIVRPHWIHVEQQNGWAEGSYQCSSWQGVGSPQCCFAETPEENAAKAA